MIFLKLLDLRRVYCREQTHPKQFAFSRILECRVHVTVFFNGSLSFNIVDTHVAESCFKEILFGTVFQQRIFNSICSNLEC